MMAMMTSQALGGDHNQTIRLLLFKKLEDINMCRDIQEMMKAENEHN